MAYDLDSGKRLWRTSPATHACSGLALAERVGAVLCGESSGRVLTVDLATGVVLGQRFDTHLGGLADLLVTRDGSMLIEIAGPVYVRWNLDGSGPANRVVRAANASRVIGYTLDDRALVIDGTEDARSGAPPDPEIIDVRTGTTLDPLDGIVAVATTADSSRMAAVFDDGTVGWYDPASRARQGDAVDPGFVPEGLTWSGDRLLVWNGGRLRGVDLERGAVVGPMVEEEAPIVRVLAPDPDHLLTLQSVGFGFELQSRNPGTGAPVGNPVTGIYNLDSRAGIVVANTLDGQVMTFDPDQLAPIGGAFPGINGTAESLALSNDGRRLAVVGQDHALRVYDVETRTPVGGDIDVGTSVGGVAMRSDGREVAVGTATGDIVAWDLDPAAWVKAACHLAGRNLTRSEWDQYLDRLASYRPTCRAYPSQ
jgi:WD40 repeat protein